MDRCDDKSFANDTNTRYLASPPPYIVETISQRQVSQLLTTTAEALDPVSHKLIGHSIWTFTSDPVSSEHDKLLKQEFICLTTGQKLMRTVIRKFVGWYMFTEWIQVIQSPSIQHPSIQHPSI